MLRKLGEFIRSRYSTSGPQGPYFASANYDPQFTYTRSTDVQRTLQSADGLLWGIYPNASTFFPAISTVDPNTDVLLIVDCLPSFNIPYNVLMVPLYFPQVSTFALSVLNSSMLQAI